MPKKKVFIIGNGFDLDLGWKTRYSDFAKSPFWHSEGISYDGLSEFLYNKSQLEKWFDLEMALLEYASTDDGHRFFSRNDYALRKDRNQFDLLTTSLMDYLAKEQEKPIYKESVAAKVFRAIIANGYFTSIYTFNYTDLYKIAIQLGLNSSFPFEYVHGSLEKRNAILGVEDKTDLQQGYSFLYKTFNSHYESHHIQYDLAEADEVVFFGHSLGKNDYHYFQQFFRRQSTEELTRNQSKRITIFTYDDNSRINLMEQLREMNDKNTNLLYSMNDFQLICTKDGLESERLKRFLFHLKKDSKEADVKRFEQITSGFSH